MKLSFFQAVALVVLPAAFGRLCVETMPTNSRKKKSCPAAFGRLCVETGQIMGVKRFNGPAAFGRLCVETAKVPLTIEASVSSRLRAAVC